MIFYFVGGSHNTKGQPIEDEDENAEPGTAIYRMDSERPFESGNPLYLFDGQTPEDSNTIAHLLNEMAKTINRLAYQLVFQAQNDQSEE